MGNEHFSDPTWVRRHTNVADLLDDGMENGSDLGAPVGSGEGASDERIDTMIAVPSTVDPVEIQFAGATLVDKVQSPHATPGMRWAAFILQALVPDGFLAMVAVSLYRAEDPTGSNWGLWTILWLAILGHLLFWLWITTKTRSR
jgi:hypothetical protein